MQFKVSAPDYVCIASWHREILLPKNLIYARSPLRNKLYSFLVFTSLQFKVHRNVHWITLVFRNKHLLCHVTLQEYWGCCLLRFIYYAKKCIYWCYKLFYVVLCIILNFKTNCSSSLLINIQHIISWRNNRTLMFSRISKYFSNPLLCANDIFLYTSWCKNLWTRVQTIYAECITQRL